MWWPFGSSGTTSQEATRSQPEPTPTPVRTAEKLPLPIKQELSREEQANLDFAEFLKEIETEQSRSQQQRRQDKKAGIGSSTAIPADISPDALYPSEMSCRSALDYAMFCQSFGGQFVNVYRYGEFRSCKNHWSDFYLCMRTRGWEEKDKVKAIQDSYRQKAVKWKTGPSSEDVWEVRTEPVRDAFQDSLEDLERKISEWKAQNPGVPDPWNHRKATSFNNAPPSS